jgi:cytochrome b561
MRLTNSENKFGLIAILLHWIIAILMIGLLIEGLYMVRVPISLHKLKLFGWHKEYGILVLMLAVFRLGWRLGNATPSLSELSWMERVGARSMHWAFYGFMFALPITGWMLTSAAGLAPSFFGWFVLPNLVQPDESLRHQLTVIHQWLGYGLILAICAHMGAALKHHFINKDDILRRMF